MIKEVIHKVQYYETDQMGITHHSNYIRWMEEARVEMLESMGWGYDKMEALGIISPVVNVEGNFKHTTTFCDEVSIQAWVQEYKGVRLVVGYKMKNQKTGEIVFTGTSSHCFLDKNGKFIRMKKEFPKLHQTLLEMAAARRN